MKKLSLILICLAVFSFTGTAFAGGHKTSVAHCGCTADGFGLEWVYLSVSQKSKGHQQHDAGDMETCFDGETLIDTYQREFDDCILFEDALLSGVSDCDGDPLEGGICAL